MKFFVLDNPKPDSPEDRLGRSDAIKEEGFNVGEALRCPECDRFLTMLKWLPPYRIELESWGKHFADIAYFSDDLIVSQRFAALFQEHGLQGLSEFAPIEVVRVKYMRRRPKEELPRYYKAAVSYSSTTIDQKASGFVWKDESKICPVCLYDTLRRYDALIVKEDTWNGDDVFYARGGGAIMVSERFKTLCEQHSLKGMVFRDPDTESHDCYPWETRALRNG